MSANIDNSKDKLSTYLDEYLSGMPLASDFSSNIIAVPSTSGTLTFGMNKNYLIESLSSSVTTLNINAVANPDSSQLAVTNILIQIPTTVSAITYGNNVEVVSEPVTGTYNRLKLEWWGTKAKLYNLGAFFLN